MLLLLVSCSAMALDVRSFLDSKLPVAGTPTHREVEYKKAYSGIVVKAATIKAKIKKALDVSLKNEHFLFSKSLEKSYTLQSDFQTFVFRDFYLDTDNLAVSRRGAAYRLRYRFKSPNHYFGYTTLPIFKHFYPHRCEIQFKWDYQDKGDSGLMEVNEARFEFRNDSFPFTLKRNAPPAPWPFTEFLSYAQEGQFRNVRLLPTMKLIETLNIAPSLQNISLTPKLELVTFRHRLHILLKTPWGSGPNPEQVFLITLDEVHGRDLRGGPNPELKQAFWEVEIEIERNTLSNLLAVSELKAEGVSPDNWTKKIAAAYSLNSLKLIQNDHSLLRDRIEQVLDQTVGMRSLPPDSKYRRVLKARY